MDILDINTDELENYVNIAFKATGQIDSATVLLHRVVEHKDWTVPQREQLIMLTRKNRQKIELIQSWSNSFYNTINAASEAFETCEKEAITSFDSLDSLVSSIASILPGNFTVSDVGSAAVKAIPFKNFRGVMEG